jgi:RecB family endonuclease NucS
MNELTDQQITMQNNQIELQALIAEVYGMIAENMNRMNREEATAYGDVAFQEKADAMRALKMPTYAIEVEVTKHGTPKTNG